MRTVLETLERAIQTDAGEGEEASKPVSLRKECWAGRHSPRRDATTEGLRPAASAFAVPNQFEKLPLSGKLRHVAPGRSLHALVPAVTCQHYPRSSLAESFLERKSHHRAPVRPTGEVLITVGLLAVVVQTGPDRGEEMGAQAGMLHNFLDVAGLVATHSGEYEGERVERLVATLFTEEFVRDNGNRGGIEPAAQIRAYGTATAQSAADGFAKEVEELSGVLVAGLIANFLREIEVPVATFLDAAGSDPHEVGGG